jgi:Arc/MetJ family transcription regulator
MNLTISIDDELLARAREAARRRGMSLQEYLRSCLRALTGERSPDDVARELLELTESQGGHSGGARFRRDDAYAGRVG